MTPTVQTSYQAHWKGATSRTVTVKVRPMITLSLVSLANGTFSTKVIETAPHYRLRVSGFDRKIWP